MGIWDLFGKFTGSNIGIDLGTANTLVWVEGRDIVVNEPTVVAIDMRTKSLIAVGEEARKMIGRTPETTKAIRPIKDGVIADFEITEELLKYLIRKVQSRTLFAKPRVVVAVPSGITDVERRAVRDSVFHAGASEVWLITEPMSGAIGVGLPIESAAGNMIVDIGGGTTEIAVIALSDIVCNTSIRIAGDEMNIAIVDYLRRRYNLLIGETTGEEIKKQIGSAEDMKEEKAMEVKGRDSVGGLPRTIKITSKEVREALKGTVSEIIGAIRSSLEKTPPELSSDIIDEGITLVGGGALLTGLGSLISRETGLKVKSPATPLECVVRGTARVLENFEEYQKVLIHGM
ncbi:MAG: rod shape-determining protein [Candidatus Stahlbacteria bacterium]|nr:rod shape-determining protein [Candidatus Stahlbacteria bacterium]